MWKYRHKRLRTKKQRRAALKELIEVGIQHSIIDFDYHLREDDKQYFQDRRDSYGSVVCYYCIQLKNFNKKDKQEHPVLMVGTVNGTKYVKCSNCRTIQCYDCFRLVVLDRKIYIRKNCMTCFYQKIQKSKKQKLLELEEKAWGTGTEIYRSTSK